MKGRGFLLVVGYLLWALFVNACNEWLITPLLLDYAALGLAALVVLVVVWLLSIPKASRRRWIGFTVFSLLIGQGISELMGRSMELRIGLMVVMVVGLVVLAWLITRVPLRYLWTGAIVLILANIWLPVKQWPFLTHFTVAYEQDLSMPSDDFQALPMEVVDGPTGQEVVTLNHIEESQKAVEESARNADGIHDTLEDILRNYQHRYELVALRKVNGSFGIQAMSPEQARSVDPFALGTTFFPTIQAHFSVDDNRVIQYMAPTVSPVTLSQMAVNPGNLSANLVGLAEQTAGAERENWKTILQPYGGPLSPRSFHVVNGWLVGNWNGQSIRVPVVGEHVVGTGSFTASNAHEVVVSGPNLLQVVNLDERKVVSEYHGDAVHPLSSDVVTGPIDKSGRDVIFVNSSPAQILRAGTSGGWDVLYTAPNASLRFEASVRLGSESYPEIITDDPSFIRNSPTRYFTSYTYRNGQLVRNWRVYHTNVVNVHPVQFTTGGPEYITAAIYGTGELFVLKRHWIPVVPLASVGLGIVVVAGFILRFSRRGGKARA